MCGFWQQGSADPDDVDEVVVLVGGEDSLEECHQVRLLSDWEWPLCHGDALRLHGLLEGILVRVILEGEVGDVLFNKDISIPGGDNVEVMTGDGDLQSPELVVPGMEAEGRGYPDSIHSGLGPTLTDVLALKAKNGYLEADPKQDLLKMAVFERHHETGTKGCGFLKGFGFKKGAMAQTVSHDAHNLLVAGTNDEDMALAANTLVECGGGMCAVADGKVLALVPLPIAGLMNDLPAEEMADLISKLDAAWKEMGCVINSPYMTMALIPLACLPELRLTNRGLVDCRTFQFADLFVE